MKLPKFIGARRRVLGLFLGAGLAACGARTGLVEPDEIAPSGAGSVGTAGSTQGGAPHRAGAGGAPGRAGAGGGGRGGAPGRAGAGGGGRGGAGAGGAGAGGALGHAGTGGAGAGGAGAGGGGAGGSAGAPAMLKLNCPTGPNDPRLPRLNPGIPTAVDGRLFASGAVSWHWELVREDCDAVVVDPEFVLQGSESSVMTFQALRPSPYHFTLTVRGAAGEAGTCRLELPTQSRGMRVELCWDTSQNTDLDLYLHNPFDQAPWYTAGSSSIIEGVNGTTCNVVNCTAELRLMQPRADFKYPDSPMSYCVGGPAPQEFQMLGRCPNPRSGQDNNQSLATGTAERIQIDAPLAAQSFRVMVQNFSNTPAAPHLYVYCGGAKMADVAAPPFPPSFVGSNPTSFGVMWRAVDIAPNVNAAGDTVDCAVTRPQSPLGQTPYVTIDDPSY